MATASLSPLPDSIPSVSVRRGPLSNNPNAVNSPLQAMNGSLASQAKLKRSSAFISYRDDQNGQPPPPKKQMLDIGHAALRVNQSHGSRTGSKAVAPCDLSKDKAALNEQPTPNARRVQSVEDVSGWRRHYKASFPNYVFYLESIPADIHTKLANRILRLGAREEKFFSIDVTHVVTTRSIPPAVSCEYDGAEPQQNAPPTSTEQAASDKPPQTINPSLLDRSAESRRRMMLDLGNRRLAQEDIVKRARDPRQADVLCKARDMGKKIWPLEKFQKMLNVLLSPDWLLQSSRHVGARGNGLGAQAAEEPNFLQLLQHERRTGPLDRDPTVKRRELIPFKGPFIYVYDIDGKQKPIIIREFAKAANHADGEWPQFRSVTNGRCFFVEDPDAGTVRNARPTKSQEEPKAAVLKHRPAPVSRQPDLSPLKPETRKRAQPETNNGRIPVDGIKSSLQDTPRPPVDLRLSNVFTGRPTAGRLLAGEPVASGLQQSKATSAICSQMVSSASGVGGAKAGTSREMYGLQRKVLQKSAPLLHQRATAACATEDAATIVTSHSSTRPPALNRVASRSLDVVPGAARRPAAAVSALTRSKSLTQPSKPAPKPGYCENCEEKFHDFDVHVVSQKHRLFALNKNHWKNLDALLNRLQRKR